MIAVLLGVLGGGCDFVRSASAPIAALHVRDAAPTRRTCLLVLLPGIGDGPSAFQREGLVDAWGERSAGCDLALLDSHFTYYREGNLVERVREDVLVPARRRGYTRVWLVGVSLGGYGALLVARESPGLVDGVVLLAPMLGVGPRTPEVLSEIRAHGGLGAWTPGPFDRPLHHFHEPRLVWQWLSQAVDAPESHPQLIVGFGEEDGSADAIALLSDELPSERVFRTSGGHDWPTWRTLFGEILRAEPWAVN